ncbi:MAG: bifunctional (p)ppGpp synthetase/guanosine-3',5'-bis(diphosphate) 3'-pyrophosphohydrolase [Firmicutes bacterium]|nr:bifunctional (p)ppGpp synthetase/guanosine-3',5'-bis(diphosphate) 3'-pyrophosphohydrolase [Bacillota bacterium]MDD7601937.1 bifunctional (p)ppGpp synthetase/guanosine-3',5'-bis(diphosphate) 3'-pyrophosphohydrolase [Bacillota bacterium]MDY5855953.1 bifunctional (p)ppGpp synthetase/guanosine-3',5'-bis(diphosphate) 3'-pyrophosphohydrolase [Anaerovoracaceae bacterium]
MLTKEEFLEELLKYNSNYDTGLIGRAFDKAQSLHDGQLRKSGEPYFVHPINVALILAQLGMDDATIVGGLLHDVVEDTEYTREELVEDFGEEIALLVDGVTKLGSIKFESKEELQAENFRKMFLAMSKDIRVLIIKLADRLHNMRTMQYMSPAKQVEKSKETLEIYAPLASRLGISTVKFEMEDLALQYLHPEEFKELKEKVENRKVQRSETINMVIKELKEVLDDMNLKYEIYGRAKHYYSIYRKMKFQKKQIDEIFDLIAVRVIVETVRDCYAVLGLVHTMWKPIPGRFKDYIAMPKPNMYQSLHTTVIGEHGEIFEIQIRTYEMHEVAEYGIAAHWKYKEGKSDTENSSDDLKLAWVRQSLEWQKDLKDPKEFLETMKMDLFATQVFVFTPKGDVIELPAGSTPLDFAFKIHSAIGCKCVGAKVNGKMVTIDYTLQNGDIVEIVTSANSSGPSVDWLKIAKSSNARNKIRNWLKKENKSDTVDKGKDLLDKYIRKKGYDPQLCAKSNYINRAMKAMNFASNEEGFIQLSNGGTLMSKFCNLLFSYYNEDNKQAEVKSNEEVIEDINKAEEARKQRQQKQSNRRDIDTPGIIVKGADNLMIRVARCCNPVPGDEIVGFITKGRGISVHRKDCSNVVNLPPEEKQRFIEVEWEDLKVGKSYNADICILAYDRKGILSDISKTCEDMDIHLSGVNAKSGKDGTVNMTITLSISSTQEMQKVLRCLRLIDGVIQVYRAKS